jgi:hypothetical protein
VSVLLVALMALFAACGEDGSNNDTILGGFSGVLIFGLVVWIIYRYVSKKKGK